MSFTSVKKLKHVIVYVCFSMCTDHPHADGEVSQPGGGDRWPGAQGPGTPGAGGWGRLTATASQRHTVLHSLLLISASFLHSLQQIFQATYMMLLNLTIIALVILIAASVSQCTKAMIPSCSCSQISLSVFFCVHSTCLGEYGQSAEKLEWI